MTTFTASEVRATIEDSLALPLPIKPMLHAYADRLEADEKGVPVAYAEFTDGGCIRMWSRQYEERLPGTRMIPLYAHPTPADTERLAEAARNGLIDALRHQRQIDEDGAEVGVSRQAIDEAAAILSALAAHYAQAQPPAASVTDTLAVFEVVSGVEGPCLTISRKADGKPRHEYRLAGPKPWGGGNTTHSFKVHTRELREQIDAIEAALAAQENPNG